MAEPVTRLPVKKETPDSLRVLQPFESLRQEIDRVFDDFGGFWQPFRRSLLGAPLFRRDVTWANMPAIDVVETEYAYEISVELPGMNEKNIEVNVADGRLTIKG